MRRALTVVTMLSLAANAALLVWSARRSDAHTAARVVDPAVEAGAATAAAPPSLRATPTRGAPDAPVVRATTPTQLRVLAGELRAAGFPAEVIRGMVDAALRERFAARRRAVLAAHPLPPFWMRDRSNTTLYHELRAVDREQQDLLRELLGPDAITPQMQAARRARYGELPDDKLDALDRLEQDYTDITSRLQTELGRDGAPGLSLPWEQEQLVAVDREKRRDLAELLTPEELRQYDLRTSRSSMVLRTQLAMLDVNEGEFVALHDLFHGEFEKFGPNATILTSSYSGPDAARSGIAVIDMGAFPTNTTALVQQTNERIKAVLGESRFEDYQRATDSTYRNARALVDRLGLPKENADAVYDLRRSVQAVTAEIRRTPGQTLEQRTESFAALLRETEAKLVEYLGPKGATAYKNTSGNWLLSLQPPTPRPPPAGN